MAVSETDVQSLAQALLGRNVAPEFLEQFTQFEDLPAVYDAMYNSAEGANYRETGVAASLDNPGVLPTAPAPSEDGGADKPETDKNPQPVTAEQVQAIYQDELGRAGADNFIQGWVDSGMTEDEIRQAVSDSPEGQYYEQVGDTLGAATGLESLEVTPEAVSQLYQANLGRPGQQEYIMNWVNSGMSLAEIERAIMDSPEGQNFAITGQPVGGLDELNTLIDQRAGQSGTTNTGNFNPLIQQYYQELFNRQAQQPGLDYFAGRLGSGDLTEDTLRDAIIAGAQGSDRLYYDASQQGGPVFDATQALFGRRPARGTYNPQTGQLEGGYGQYRSQIDAGELTPEQLRGRLVQLAYNRGPGGGAGQDYQYYLDTLGIDRANNPFLQDDGTYANIAYGSDLSQYQQKPGMPAPPTGGGGMPPGMPGKGGGMGRIPGQYITGNQLYSGLPYGMTQPMGMMNFMQPMMYQPPQLSQQYMPNRGLMSGFSTGFGPYGGYQRPRFGGGKGGMMRRPMPYGMGGGKGGFGY
tara:strand:+ start:46 stop:1611 length:1566 start_codon:yes stop_codon:yes gene_type:complete